MWQNAVKSLTARGIKFRWNWWAHKTGFEDGLGAVVERQAPKGLVSDLAQSCKGTPRHLEKNSWRADSARLVRGLATVLESQFLYWGKNLFTRNRSFCTGQESLY